MNQSQTSIASPKERQIHIYDHCETLKNPHTIRKEQDLKFPVLWLAFVSLSVWVVTEKGVRLAWDLVSRSRITLHFGTKAEKPKPKPNQTKSKFQKPKF